MDSVRAEERTNEQMSHLQSMYCGVYQSPFKTERALERVPLCQFKHSGAVNLTTLNLN